MFRSRIYGFLAVITALVLALTGCSPTVYVGQINAFDGATYSSMVVAHAALTSLSTQISTKYPKYTAEFNDAAAAYSVTYNSYVLFRQAPSQNQAQLAPEIASLTVAIVALEDAITHDLPVAQAQKDSIRAKALKIRTGFTAKAGTNVSLSDILTELEIAASIAQLVPGASPYAQLAELAIQAAASATSALSAASGQAVNMAAIAPVPSLAVATAAANIGTYTGVVVKPSITATPNAVR